jgi:hypothetical protein
MSHNKIFTFGDGFATGHIWPEWPQILQALLPDYTVINTAGIGAGTEYLVANLIDLLPSMHHSKVVFQWPWHKRFDKLIEDNTWTEQIAADSYGFNCVHDTQSRSWWLSSASQMHDVQHYHNHLVQDQQQRLRQSVYRVLVENSLSNIDCLAVHTSTEQQDLFSKRYLDLRGTSVQPSPIVHFLWLTQEIVPQLCVQVDIARQQQLEQLIRSVDWQPFANNQTKLWDSVIKSLSL